MKKLRILFAALGAAAALALAGIWLNGQFTVLYNGGTLAAGTGPYCAALRGWESSGSGRWTITFTAAQAQEVPVLFFGQNGGTLAEGDPALRRLPPDVFAAAWQLRPLAAGETVTLEIEGAAAPDAWLVSYGALIRLIRLRLILQWIALSSMGIMILFSLALYRYKREPYLLYFLCYAAVMLVWGLLVYAAPDQYGARPLVRSVNRLFFSLMLLSSIWVSFGLTGRRQQRWLPPRWQSRQAVCAAAAFFCVLHYLLSGWPRLALVCAATGVCLLVLWDACAAGLPGSGLLLAGAVLTGSTRPLVVLQGVGTALYPEALPMYVIRCARFYDLPFALGCMLFICRQFAVQFDRTEQLARELDARVAERTRELTEQQEARKSMMLNIFHDLRSPLFVMKNGLDAVAAAPEMLPRMLPVLQERTAFMHGLTEDLFLAAKLEQKQILLNEDRVELCGEAQQVCAALQTEADKKGVALHIDCPAPLWVWGDSFRLRQVVQNLVANAIYYTPAGGQVRVTAQAEEGTALLCVADTGCGIAPEDQAAVFRRYFHTTTQNKHDSSGLGLTIALDLVRLHHGDIRLESQVGKGSRFTVVLPLLPDQA